MKVKRQGNVWSFQCPGCGSTHHATEGWQFDGDVNKPTFTPSIKVTSGHYMDRHKNGDSCWCTFNVEHPDDPAPFECFRCHSFVTDGRIQFLNDCTHSLKGQIVDLPDWDEK